MRLEHSRLPMFSGRSRALYVPYTRCGYTPGMKWLAPALVAVALVSCSNPEADKLRQENAQLKSQLEVISQERDALKSQVDSVRAALTPSTSSSTGSGTGSDGMGSGAGSDSSNPSNPSDSGSSGTGLSGTGATSGDTSASPGGPQASPGVLAYAQDVLKLATTYGAETGTPPTDCQAGYEAGATKLALGDGLALKSCVVEKVNDQLRVSLETTDGAKLTVPSNGP
jgi:hypothetical protein